jgi:hypothetical protein
MHVASEPALKSVHNWCVVRAGNLTWGPPGSSYWHTAHSRSPRALSMVQRGHCTYHTCALYSLAGAFPIGSLSTFALIGTPLMLEAFYWFPIDSLLSNPYSLSIHSIHSIHSLSSLWSTLYWCSAGSLGVFFPFVLILLSIPLHCLLIPVYSA